VQSRSERWRARRQRDFAGIASGHDRGHPPTGWVDDVRAGLRYASRFISCILTLGRRVSRHRAGDIRVSGVVRIVRRLRLVAGRKVGRHRASLLDGRVWPYSPQSTSQSTLRCHGKRPRLRRCDDRDDGFDPTASDARWRTFCLAPLVCSTSSKRCVSIFVRFTETLICPPRTAARTARAI